ncbi:hypothetical protein [Streptomyces soliscabiei]|uniref:hypothetical protein n=1 Tax=Streptomyces soliscabiei TaxID=588897 RepID=UPI0029B3C296|nr:hypothetical protein [Streptomyces sp. NY05-11A]MDX2683665.1 hypothetical protein [Streptomyces sp. NY05-11A]
MVVAADTFAGHLRFRDGDVEGVRRVLGRAEAAVINVQENMRDLRVAIGDAERGFSSTLTFEEVPSPP